MRIENPLDSKGLVSPIVSVIQLNDSVSAEEVEADKEDTDKDEDNDEELEEEEEQSDLAQLLPPALPDKKAPSSPTTPLLSLLLPGGAVTEVKGGLGVKYSVSLSPPPCVLYSVSRVLCPELCDPCSVSWFLCSYPLFLVLFPSSCLLRPASFVLQHLSRTLCPPHVSQVLF